MKFDHRQLYFPEKLVLLQIEARLDVARMKDGYDDAIVSDEAWYSFNRLQKYWRKLEINEIGMLDFI